MPTLAQQGLRLLNFSSDDARLVVRATGNDPYMTGRSILGLQRAIEGATGEEFEVSTTLHRKSVDDELYLRLVFSTVERLQRDRHQRLAEQLAQQELPALEVDTPSQPSAIPDVLFMTRAGQVMLNPVQAFSLAQIMAWALKLAEQPTKVKDITFGLRSEYPCFEVEATPVQSFIGRATSLWSCRYPYGATLTAEAQVGNPGYTHVYVFTDYAVTPGAMQAAHDHCDGKVGSRVTHDAAGQPCKGYRDEAFRLYVQTTSNHLTADLVVSFLRYLGIQPIGTVDIHFDRYTRVVHTFRAYDAPPPEQGPAAVLPTPLPDNDPEGATPTTTESGAQATMPLPPVVRRPITDPTAQTHSLLGGAFKVQRP